MGTSYRFIVAFLLAFILARSIPVWAAKGQRGQIYSATEDEVSTDVGEAPPAPAVLGTDPPSARVIAQPSRTETQPRPKTVAKNNSGKKAAKKVAKGKKAKIATVAQSRDSEMDSDSHTAVLEPKAEAPHSANTTDARVTYDLVPVEQKDPIVQRIRLCEVLVEKYNRAYDYRAFTLRELEGVLARLESNPSRRTPPAPAPGPATEPASVADPVQSAPALDNEAPPGSFNLPSSDDDIGAPAPNG